MGATFDSDRPRHIFFRPKNRFWGRRVFFYIFRPFLTLFHFGVHAFVLGFPCALAVAVCPARTSGFCRTRSQVLRGCKHTMFMLFFWDFSVRLSLRFARLERRAFVERVVRFCVAASMLCSCFCVGISLCVRRCGLLCTVFRTT